MFVAALLASCQQADPGGWAKQIAEQHAQVDSLLDAGQGREAARVLQALLTSAPGEHPHRRPLLQDTYFRLARLSLASGDPTSAEAQATAGLAFGAGADIFTANLLVVRASAREARGDNAGALTDYERALAINEALLEQGVPNP